MAKQTISRAQLHKANIDAIDLLGSQDFKVVELKDLRATVDYLGAQYALKLTEEADRSKASSSGKGIDSIQSLDVNVNGQLYVIEIAMDKYMEFVSGGVDGWAKNRGGQYQFKGKGVPDEMVKSVKEWINRSGQIARIKTQSSKKSIIDSASKQAKQVAFMIKRQGIKPRHFVERATKDITALVEQELSAALKVDIINNLH